MWRIKKEEHLFFVSEDVRFFNRDVKFAENSSIVRSLICDDAFYGQTNAVEFIKTNVHQFFCTVVHLLLDRMSESTLWAVSKRNKCLLS